jgi:PhnB protein
MASKGTPEGYQSVTPHITVKGASEAIDFYKKAFGAVEERRMVGPDGKKLIHAAIRIGNSVVMVADEFPEFGECASKAPTTLGGTAVSLHIYVEDVDAMFKQALDAGAREFMPVSDMFWGDRYGQVEDPFGHKWSIATHIRDVSEEEMAEASKMACAEPS